MNVEPQGTIEIARFLAAGPTPEQIIAFRPSPEATERAYTLIATEREGTMTAAEHAELESYVTLEHMMRLVKVEAHRILQQRAS